MITISTASYLVEALSGLAAPDEPRDAARRRSGTRRAGNLLADIARHLRPGWLRRMRDYRFQETALPTSLERLGAVSSHLLDDLGYLADGTPMEERPKAILTVAPPTRAQPSEAPPLPQDAVETVPETHRLAA